MFWVKCTHFKISKPRENNLKIVFHFETSAAWLILCNIFSISIKKGSGFVTEMETNIHSPQKQGRTYQIGR